MFGGPGWVIIPTSLVFFALLVVLLRWTFTTGHSLIERRSKPGTADDYGLLVAITTPANFIEAEVARLMLEDAGIRATLTTTLDGPRLMVFRADQERARTILA